LVKVEANGETSFVKGTNANGETLKENTRSWDWADHSTGLLEGGDIKRGYVHYHYTNGTSINLTPSMILPTTSGQWSNLPDRIHSLHWLEIALHNNEHADEQRDTHRLST